MSEIVAVERAAEVQVQASAGWTKEQIDTIRATVAKGATDAELQMFLHLAGAYRLDPLAHEIWFIKTKEKPVIMTSRDGYMKIANNSPTYDGMDADVVYSGDSFQKTTQGVQHSYTTKGRGEIIGAYATVYRKNVSHPVYVFAPFRDYRKDTQPWRQYPHSMILKVAESMGLKRAFSIDGLVTREELDESDVMEGAPRLERGQARRGKQTPKPEEPPATDAEVVTRETTAAAENKKRLYMGYMDLMGDKAAVQKAMMDVTEGRGSADWTDEDIKNLEFDLIKRQEAAHTDEGAEFDPVQMLDENGDRVIF